MKRITNVFVAAAGAALLSGVAFAAGWVDFEAAFPLYPCNDGWIACYQDGERITPDLTTRGLPQPANARIEWFDLRATAGFSPFMPLSDYPKGGPPAVADVGDTDTDIPPPPAYEDTDIPPPAPAAPYRPSPSPSPSSMSRPSPSPSPSPVSRPSPSPSPSPSMTRPTSPSPSPTAPSLTRPTSPSPAPSLTRPTSPSPSPSPVAPTMSRPAPSPAVADIGTPEPQGELTCDDLVRLEPSAMMGRLSNEQIACLEASLMAVDKQTDKDKISRVLMSNSWSKGDHRTWEALVKRHLDEINQSDPDLCYKYALFLSKKGPGRAWGVIKWSDVALENRTVWTGETYKSRVYNLYKLRASAAQDLWKAAEEKYAAAPSEETSSAVDDSRGLTKTYAREWYEYAKASEKDTTKALQLCISAAGTAEFCEGG